MIANQLGKQEVVLTEDEANIMNEIILCLVDHDTAVNFNFDGKDGFFAFVTIAYDCETEDYFPQIFVSFDGVDYGIVRTFNLNLVIVH